MKSKKVLIVDDDYDVITTLKTILQKEGYQIITAANKMEGKKLALAEKPDLAILDVMMTTHYEGFELAEDFAKDEHFKNVKILIHTSIDVLTTTNPSVQLMAREYRNNPVFKDLQVILLKDIVTGEAGVDYRTENGKTVWFPVDGFLGKPVNTEALLSEVKRLLS